MSNTEFFLSRNESIYLLREKLIGEALQYVDCFLFNYQTIMYSQVNDLSSNNICTM